MNNFTRKSIITIAIIGLIAFTKQSQAQCKVTADAFPQVVHSGDSVTLTADGGCGLLMKNDFNNGTIGSGWYSAQATPVFSNPCGPGPEGAHLWVGATPSNNRTLVTTDYDVSIGGCYVEWWMRYGLDSLSGSCEAPDASDEGVHMQWSTDNGATWTDFPGPGQAPDGSTTLGSPFNTTTPGSGGYWSPDSSHSNQQQNELYYWNKYKDSIPSAASTAHTKFRWVQLEYDGQGHDTWGIDEIKIKCPTSKLNVAWGHGPTVLNPPAVTLPPKGNSQYDTTFFVTVSDTTYSVTDSVTVTVVPDSTSKVPETKNGIKIYPNPSKGIVNLEIPNSIGHNSQISVYDFQGELVRKCRTADKKITRIDLSEVNSGIYLLVIENQDHILTRKVILE